MARKAILNATIIDGLGNKPIEGKHILIEDDLIVGITNQDEADAFQGAAGVEVLDAKSQWLMPGLIDAHCHMTYGESMLQVEQDIYTSVEARTLRSAWNVQKVLAAGVTSISQPGGSYFIGVAVRDGIDEGRIIGPRMASAGRYISTSNGLTDFYPDEVGVVEGGIGIRCNTLDEMISEIRRQKKNGVDFIKLADSAYGQFQSFRDSELREIADLCHQLGLSVTIHARGDAEMRAAVMAGFDWVMHGNTMTQETVELLAEKQTPLVPTLVLLDNWKHYGEKVGSHMPIVEGCKRMLERTFVSLHMAKDAGVRFGMGTDTGFAVTPYGEWHARELELLMEYAGLSALEAIQASTFNNGRSVGLEGKVGAIADGFLADLLILDSDPVADITVLQDRHQIAEILLAGDKVTVPEVESWPNPRAPVFTRVWLDQATAEEYIPRA